MDLKHTSKQCITENDRTCVASVTRPLDIVEISIDISECYTNNNDLISVPSVQSHVPSAASPCCTATCKRTTTLLPLLVLVLLLLPHHTKSDSHSTTIQLIIAWILSFLLFSRVPAFDFYVYSYHQTQQLLDMSFFFTSSSVTCFHIPCLSVYVSYHIIQSSDYSIRNKRVGFEFYGVVTMDIHTYIHTYLHSRTCKHT